METLIDSPSLVSDYHHFDAGDSGIVVKHHWNDNKWIVDANAHATSESKHPDLTSGDDNETLNEDSGLTEEEAAPADLYETHTSKKPPMNYELQQGYRILRELMADSNKSVNWPFMNHVDNSYPETHDYYDRVKNPMWLLKMEEKFDAREYKTITEFVADFRQMLENCYRYNGPDHYISKRGQRFETMLEQKLALLSRELRAKTTIAATSGKSMEEEFITSGLRRRPKNFSPHDSSALLSQLRSEEAQKEREMRKQQMADRKAANEAVIQEMIDWEKSLLSEPIQSQMKHSWELPQIGHFLFLCQEPLNVGEISQFELERCLAMAKQSQTLQLIMTSLLSTPTQRMKIDKRTLMPYSVWTFKLTMKLDTWYKTLDDCKGDKVKAAYKLGLDPYAFNVLGLKNPLRRKQFHEHSFYRKVWILKCLCDHFLEMQESLQNAIEAQPPEEQREYLLGCDGKGDLYLHFPQFCGADLRIYRQRKPLEPDFSEEERDVKDMSKVSRAKASEIKTKFKKINSNSSPVPGETSSRSKRAAARNYPAPKALLSDLNLDLTSGKGSKPRKTRNSAEASLPILLSASDLTISRHKTQKSSSVADNVSFESNRSFEAENSLSLEDISKDCLTSPGDSKETERERPAIEKKSIMSISEFKDDLVNNIKSEHVESTSKTQNSSTESLKNLSVNASESVSHISDKIIKEERNSLKITNLSLNEGKCSDSLPSLHTMHMDTICNGNDDSSDKNVVTEDSQKDQDDVHIFRNSGSLKLEHENSRNCDGLSPNHMKVSTTQFDCHASSSNSQMEGVLETSRLKTCVQAALLDHCTYSTTSVLRKPHIKEEIIMEDDEGEDEEYEPDLDEFELIVDSVDGLQELVKQFADPPPTSDTPGSRKNRKQRNLKPVQRKQCEIELHQRLAFLLKELEPWEQKLVQAVRRARIKLRREFDDYKEEAPKEDNTDEWDTDTEVQLPDEEENVNSLEDGDYESVTSQDTSSQIQLNSSKKQNVTSSTPSITSEATESDHRDIEEYEMDVSSRGRLRKRRLIPTSTEDQGIKKKKVVKRPDEVQENSIGDFSSIVQKAQVDKLTVSNNGATLPLSSVAAGDGPVNKFLGSTHNASSSPQAFHLIRTVTGSAAFISSKAVGKSRSKQSSHPEIQKLLAIHHPVSASDPSKPYKIVQKSSVSEVKSSDTLPQNSTGSSLKVNSFTTAINMQISPLATASDCKPPASVVAPGGSNQRNTTMVVGLVGGKPHLLNLSSLPPSVLQQLIKTNALRIQTMPAVVSNANSITSLPSHSSTSTGAHHSQTNTLASPIHSSTVTCHSSQLNHITVIHHSHANIGKRHCIPITANSQTLVSTGISESQSVLSTIQSNSGMVIPNSFITTSKSVISATDSTAVVPRTLTPVVKHETKLETDNHELFNTIVLRAAAPNAIGSQATLKRVGSVAGGIDVLKCSSGLAGLSTISTVNPSAQLGSPCKMSQRYAGNVTVKTLLEKRAARKPSDETDTDSQGDSSTSDTPSSPIKSTEGFPFTAPSTSMHDSVSLSMVGVVPATTLVTRTIPGVLRLPTQPSLDYAVQSVVTTYHTTLPTADIKVPSPTTLPSLSPRKNVTKTVQSMKAPISVPIKLESKTSSSIVPQSSVAGLAASGLSSLTGQNVATNAAVSKSPTVRIHAVKDAKILDPTVKNCVLVRVMPQGPPGPHTFVQGILTPEGIVIPQGTLTQTIQPAATNGNELAVSAAVQTQSGDLQTPSKQPGSVLPTSSTKTTKELLAWKTGTSKVTMDVLKSMLAAKVGTDPSGQILQHPVVETLAPGASVISSDNLPAIGLGSRSQVSTNRSIQMALNPQSSHVAAIQNPGISIIPSSFPTNSSLQQIHLPVSQVGKIINGPVQLGSPEASCLQNQQQQIITSSLGGRVLTATSGLHLTSVPRSTAVHMVASVPQVTLAPSNIQPVIAALQPGALSLQLLQSTGGFQKVNLLTSQQQPALSVNPTTTIGKSEQIKSPEKVIRQIQGTGDKQVKIDETKHCSSLRHSEPIGQEHLTKVDQVKQQGQMSTSGFVPGAGQVSLTGHMGNVNILGSGQSARSGPFILDKQVSSSLQISTNSNNVNHAGTTDPRFQTLVTNSAPHPIQLCLKMQPTSQLSPSPSSLQVLPLPLQTTGVSAVSSRMTFIGQVPTISTSVSSVVTAPHSSSIQATMVSTVDTFQANASGIMTGAGVAKHIQPAYVTSALRPVITPSSLNAGVSVRTSVSPLTNPVFSLPAQSLASPIDPVRALAVLGLNPGQPLQEKCTTKPITTLDTSGSRVTVVSLPHLQMTVTPDPTTGHFTVLPQGSQSIAETNKTVTKTISGILVPSVSEKFSPLPRQDSMVSRHFKQNVNPSPKLEMLTLKRSLSVDDEAGVTQIKRLHGDTGQTAGTSEIAVGVSGAMLATLSQMVGVQINKSPVQMSSNLSPASSMCPTAPKSPGRLVNTLASNGQRLFSANPNVGINTSSSQTLRSLASQMNPAESSATITTFSSASPLSSALSSSGVQNTHGQINISQLLQKLQQQTAQVSVSPADSVAGSQNPQQRQATRSQELSGQKLVMMQTATGQLLNIPVTAGNGVVRMHPKASLQMGNQIVTVLSPNNTMIQNVRSPVTGGPLMTTLNTLGLQEQMSCAQQNVIIGNNDTVISWASGFGSPVLQTSVVKPESVLSSTQSVNQPQTVLASLHTKVPKQSVVTNITLPERISPLNKGITSSGDNFLANMKPRCSVTTNIVSTTKIQPGTCMPNGLSNNSLKLPSVSSNMNSVQQGPPGAQNGDSLQASAVVGSSRLKPQQMMEEEQAALNLLTFANQMPLE